MKMKHYNAYVWVKVESFKLDVHRNKSKTVLNSLRVGWAHCSSCFQFSNCELIGQCERQRDSETVRVKGKVITRGVLIEWRERLTVSIANEMSLNHIYLESIRSFSLFAHILLTTVLYWTKFDCIQVTLSPQSSDLAYSRADETLTGLLSVSIIFLLLEVVFRAAEIHVTLWTLIHLFLDSCACFFITWIVLDGLAWETYIYVFFFCR